MLVHNFVLRGVVSCLVGARSRPPRNRKVMQGGKLLFGGVISRPKMKFVHGILTNYVSGASWLNLVSYKCW